MAFPLSFENAFGRAWLCFTPPPRAGLKSPLRLVPFLGPQGLLGGVHIVWNAHANLHKVLVDLKTTVELVGLRAVIEPGPRDRIVLELPRFHWRHRVRVFHST